MQCTSNGLSPICRERSQDGDRSEKATSLVRSRWDVRAAAPVPALSATSKAAATSSSPGERSIDRKRPDRFSHSAERSFIGAAEPGLKGTGRPAEQDSSEEHFRGDLKPVT